VRSRAEHFLIAQSFVSRLRPRGRAQSARVPESDGATARAVCRTLGIRSHRCLHACWRGRSMGPIFDHREAAAGVSRPPRTACDGCGRAMAQRRGQFAGPWVSGHTDACTHVGVGGRWDRFSTIEKRRRECAGCRAQSARVCGERWRDGAGSLPDLGISGPLGRCTHIGVGGRRTDFRPSMKRGQRCLREPAHGLGEWPRAMARRRRLLPDLRISAPLGRCTHIGVGAQRDRFSTIDERGRRCLREPAHGLRE